MYASLMRKANKAGFAGLSEGVMGNIDHRVLAAVEAQTSAMAAAPKRIDAALPIVGTIIGFAVAAVAYHGLKSMYEKRWTKQVEVSRAASTSIPPSAFR